MHLAAHFSSLPLPKYESDSEHLPKTLIEDKPFHVKLCRAELPIDNKKISWTRKSRTSLVEWGLPPEDDERRGRQTSSIAASTKGTSYLRPPPSPASKPFLEPCKQLPLETAARSARQCVCFPLFCVSDCSGVIFADDRVDVSYKITPL